MSPSVARSRSVPTRAGSSVEPRRPARSNSVCSTRSIANRHWPMQSAAIAMRVALIWLIARRRPPPASPMTCVSGTRTSANVNAAWWLPSRVPNRCLSVTPARLVSMSTIAGPTPSTSTSALMKSASAPPVTYDFAPLTTNSSPSRRAQVWRGALAGSVNPKPLRSSPARYGSKNWLRNGSPISASTPGEGPKTPGR